MEARSGLKNSSLFSSAVLMIIIMDQEQFMMKISKDIRDQYALVRRREKELADLKEVLLLCQLDQELENEQMGEICPGIFVTFQR